MSKKISMTKLIIADFYRRNAETIINSQKSIIFSISKWFEWNWLVTGQFAGYIQVHPFSHISI